MMDVHDEYITTASLDEGGHTPNKRKSNDVDDEGYAPETTPKPKKRRRKRYIHFSISLYITMNSQ